MKFKLFFIIILVTSCTVNSTKLENRAPYNSKGFAFIYNESDLNNRIIKGKLDNSKIEVAHRDLRVNSLILITNPKTKDSIVIKNSKKSEYPDFYKILITEKLAEKLNIDKDLPLIEISEIKKNKSFIAKEAKIFKEEKKISSKAPVTSVEISNISKNRVNKKKFIKDKFFILIGTFYSKETVEFLKKRIIVELPDFDTKKLIIRKKNNKNINLISGPYYTINLMKNDYIELKKFGFEELDIIADE